MLYKYDFSQVKDFEYNVDDIWLFFRIEPVKRCKDIAKIQFYSNSCFNEKINLPSEFCCKDLTEGQNLTPNQSAYRISYTNNYLLSYRGEELVLITHEKLQKITLTKNWFV